MTGVSDDGALARHYAQVGEAEGRLANAGAYLTKLEAELGPLPEGFVPSIYRSLNADLHVYSEDWELAAHYLRFGKDEGRPFIKASLGSLPDDFVHGTYRLLNLDLRDISQDRDLEEHYLLYGKQEGRRYTYDVSGYEREYRNLRASEAAGLVDAVAAEEIGGFANLLRSHNIVAGDWLTAFNLVEFNLLNSGWLPRQATSRVEGMSTFVREGLDRLAPISIAYVFEPAFYRTIVANPSLWESDAALYREWLGFGIGRGEAGNEGQFLFHLLGESSFPACFDEDAYRARVPSDVPQPGPGRALALQHFFDTGHTLDLAATVDGPGLARFYQQLGSYHFALGQAALAKAAFDRSLAEEPRSGRVHHRRGDALQALGRERDALADYLVAVDEPDAGVWSHIHAAKGLASAGEPQAALDMLLRSAPAWRGSAPWREACHEVLGLVFECEARLARDLYGRGEREDADALLADCLRRIEDAIPVVDPLPVSLPPPRDGPIVLLANRDLAQCDHYRVVQKQRQLEHGGWDCEIFDARQTAACRAALDRARAAIFYRVPATPPILHVILYARALGLPTFYEIDDLLFDPRFYPDPFDTFEGQITEAEHVGLHVGVPLFRHAMSLCHEGLASTPALAEAMRPIVRSGTCHILRNGLDERNAAFLARPWTPFSGEALTIFYGSGTKAHNSDFTELAAPALLDALTRHPHVRLVVAGYLHLDSRFRPFAGRIRELGFTPDVQAYWEVLAGADISLAVLARNAMTDAKSEIKWLEAAMCGVPSVVSGTRTYREILVEGEDVLMADTPEEWRTALERMISDPELRRRIGAKARAKARARYTLDHAVATLRAFLPPPRLAPARPSPHVAASRPSRPDLLRPGPHGAAPSDIAGKPRLLVVNVFYPPQTIGGATRVVRDNVDYLIDRSAGTFELAIVATDDEADPPYRTRVDSYRGIPVLRIAAPRESHMDWRPFNAAMIAPFSEALDRLAPDLVHFHCIQRLTGSVVEAVQGRGIPYLVTLHDAWWISDFQFLVDGDAQLQLPTEDPLDGSFSRELSAVASIARRRQLGRLLEGASAQLAVSETFAELYRAAGHPRTVAVPNGVSALGSIGRRPPATHHVRLGHLGGRTPHKGATLIEIVLRSTPFGNLALTLVDHAHPAQYAREEVWGTTPVRIVGALPQERVKELYASLDVLLAPSIWPESFGLVAREARASGLWVIASDRGAMGEDLTEGVDGWAIDVSTTDGLRQALARIEADPDRFRAVPPSSGKPLRSADDQGADLVKIYRELLGGKLLAKASGGD